MFYYLTLSGYEDMIIKDKNSSFDPRKFKFMINEIEDRDFICGYFVSTWCFWGVGDPDQRPYKITQFWSVRTDEIRKIIPIYAKEDVLKSIPNDLSDWDRYF